MTFEEFQQKLGVATSREKAYNLAVGYLKDRPRFDWTGVYALEGQELVLRAFVGKPTVHMRGSVCKGEIKWSAPWFKCTVSTCNRTRVALAFCSTDCWDTHLPEARHRDPGFTEHKAPNPPRRT